MKLVVDIDEEDFEIMKHNIAVNNPLCPLSQAEMVSKVVNGTPLPEGRRIVDGDEILMWMINKGIIDELKCGEVASVFEQATIIPAKSEDKEWQLNEKEKCRLLLALINGPISIFNKEECEKALAHIMQEE